MTSNIVKIETTKEGVELHVIQERPLVRGFISGIVVGVGSAIGATFVFGFLIFFLGHLDTVPIVGKYISEIINYVQQTSH
ncbi:MAG TPA: DUF5665 domain-containing protein [Candidatus Saccharimonadales bacterium]|nr:DUF5665 domain-containing protein [Candidatus Saccharimonadales bacterium]